MTWELQDLEDVFELKLISIRNPVVLITKGLIVPSQELTDLCFFLRSHVPHLTLST